MPTQKSFSKGSACPTQDNGTLRIYSMRFCPYAERTRLVLAHKKIPHETVNIDLKQKPEWYFEKNPLGLVPTLEQGDKIIYESGICDDYLDDVYDTNKLNPSDPYERARHKILMERFSKVITLFYKLYRMGDTEEEKKETVESVTNGLMVFENELSGKYVGGKTVSMVDVHFWPWFERLGMFKLMTKVDVLPREKFPKLTAWVDAMYATDAVKACSFSADDHFKFVQSYISGSPDYDMGLE